MKSSGTEYSKYKDMFRLANELVIMEYLITHIPRLAVELPLFYGLLTDKNGDVKGILTEDFTKGGKNRIEDLPVEDDDISSILLPVIYGLDYRHIYRAIHPASYQISLEAESPCPKGHS